MSLPRWDTCDDWFSHDMPHFMTFQCERLEEHCYESFLVTVSSAGHLVMGSAKGRQFLEERMGLIEDFINFCMGKECCYLVTIHMQFKYVHSILTWLHALY